MAGSKKSIDRFIKPFLKYFKENLNLSLSGKTNLKIENKTYTVAKFVEFYSKKEALFSEEMGSRVKFYSFLEEARGEIKELQTDEEAFKYLLESTYNYMVSSLSSKANEKVVAKVEKFLAEHKFNWSRHIPVMDIRSSDKLMYDQENKQVNHSVTYKAWKDWVATRDSENRKLLLQSVIPAKVDYDPKEPSDLKYKDVAGQKNILHLNAHKAPDWRKLDISNPKPDKQFFELMEHLFPNEDCRDYVYHWMYYMMTDRNHCYLLLHGEQGIGKNTFVKILEGLVGEDNFSLIPPSFWESPFNKELKYKRCVLFDESVIQSKNLGMIRAMTDVHLTIEEKGIDSITITNHCSYVIANNRDKKNYILYSDRRYSVPVITSKKILNVFGQDWLDEFYIRVKEQDFIANIGHWILDRHRNNVKYTNNQPYRSSLFYDLVEKSLTEWQQYIIELIESRQYTSIPLQTLREENRKFDVGRTKISGFLEEHRDRDGDVYGYLRQLDGERTLEVSEKYWPKDTTDYLDEKNNEDEDIFKDMEF